MNDVLKLLRYNTGTDKKAFVEFKDEFDAVIFNATIVAYSGSAIADLVSVHQNKYIIDPQTHIFQHDTSVIKSLSKKTGTFEVKKSILKYLDKMPVELKNSLITGDKALSFDYIEQYANELCECVFKFQTAFIDEFIEKKEYNKYLEFVNAVPKPQLLIAPYFMIKRDYTKDEMKKWLALNKKMLEIFIKQVDTHTDVAAQLVIDREVLTNPDFLDFVKTTYVNTLCKYVFIWIDDFNTISANKNQKTTFSSLLKVFKENNIKPIMSYGGFDSIFLCHSEIECRLYGVAQSVGYGEQREITPVGGGMPTNKYYFYPTHERLRFRDAVAILREHGYFNDSKGKDQHAQDYYANICDCKICKEIIADNIDNFEVFNESISFVNKKGVARSTPTTDASFIAAQHFLACKIKEWEMLKNSLDDIKNDFIREVEKYTPDQLERIKEWCEIYAR